MDPFCGSGTTLVEAQLAGIPAIGIDLNPIACLISRVKTQPLTADLVPFATCAIVQAKSLNGNIVVPRIPNLEHWFKPDIQEAIARLLVEIDRVEIPETRESLRLALSSILVRVSNQESDTRYAAVQKNLSTDKFYALFLASAKRVSNVKMAYTPKTWQVEVICKDILKVARDEIAHPVGLVITSPPYPNAYEYWLYHKYRMYWLGYNPIKVKEQEIGARAHYFKKNHPTEQDFRLQMQKVLELLWATVVRGGHVCILMGRSKIHGKIVDNASILTEIAADVGFTPLTTITRRIASTRKTFNLSHANIHTESLLVFQR